VLIRNVESTENESWMFEVFEIMDEDCDGYVSFEELSKTVKMFNLDIDEKEIKLIM
jgi:Ca2+-binding EF-hand superfamily protein